MNRSTPRAPRNTASLYVRLSKASRDESTGRVTQEQDLRALADRHGLAVVAVHEDDGESGALRNRPEFLAWLQDAREGHVDHLLAYRLDRVSRGGAAGLARFLDTLEGTDADGNPTHHPVRFLSSADGLDSRSPAWDIQAAVMGALAKAERDLIRSRIRRSKALAKEQGRYLGGPIATGFRVVPNPDGPGKALEPDPAALPVLRAAGMALLSDSIGAAVRVLEESDVRPPRAAHWSRTTATQTLLSDVARRRIWSPAESRLLREAVRVRQPAGRRYRPRVTRLLTGVLVCDGCDVPVAWAGSSRYSSRQDRYQCRSWSSGSPCPARASAAEEPVDELVEAAWLEGWGSLPETTVERHDDARANRLAELADALDVLWSSLPTLRGADRAAALAQVEALEAEQAETEARPASVAAVLRETGRTWAEAWHAADRVTRNSILRRSGATVRLLPGVARTPVTVSRLVGLDALRDPA